MTNNINYYEEKIKRLEAAQSYWKAILLNKQHVEHAQQRITEIDASMKDTSWSNLRNYHGLPLVTFCAGLAGSAASAFVAYKTENIVALMAAPYLIIGSFVPHIILTDCHPANA